MTVVGSTTTRMDDRLPPVGERPDDAAVLDRIAGQAYC
jgi:hypothetical protein